MVTLVVFRSLCDGQKINMTMEAGYDFKGNENLTICVLLINLCMEYHDTKYSDRLHQILLYYN